MSNIKSEILTTLKKLVGIYEEQPADETPATPVEETPVAEAFNKVYSESDLKISQLNVGGEG